MSIQIKDFSKTTAGQSVKVGILANDTIEVHILSYGATIQQLLVPDRKGNKVDVVLGYPTVQDYELNTCFLGAVVGRYANRIGGSKFTLYEEEYHVTPNEGKNCLHSGLHGFDKTVFDMGFEGDDTLVLTAASPDGTDGFPGNAELEVRYSLAGAGLMRQIVEQQEFWVDTITLTAASSPEGAYAFNDRLSQGRAQALKRYLVRRYGRSIDTMLTVRWVAEDWQELTNRIRTDREVVNRDAILELIVAEKNPDRREQAIRQRFPEEYAYIRSVIYPQLRAVNFRYNLRRKGMVKDTIHTTELDTAYARGVELLQKRKYAKALYILNDYNDRNTVVAHLSLDHNERAMELLATMPKDAVTEYLRAIACSRLGRKEEGRRHFLEACRLDERMEYRGNLDPEIAELLK